MAINTMRFELCDTRSLSFSRAVLWIGMNDDDDDDAWCSEMLELPLLLTSTYLNQGILTVSPNLEARLFQVNMRLMF